MTADALNPSERKVLLTLWRLRAETGRSPTYLDLAAALGWSSGGHVQECYDGLERKGCLTRVRASHGTAVPRGWVLALADPDRAVALSPAEGEALVARLTGGRDDG